MKKKITKKDSNKTFKMQGPDGRIHELHDSHRANIQNLIDNDGDVEGYVMKYGGMTKALLGDQVGTTNLTNQPAGQQQFSWDSPYTYPDQPSLAGGQELPADRLASNFVVNNDPQQVDLGVVGKVREA
jgi:hypothetical protein